MYYDIVDTIFYILCIWMFPKSWGLGGTPKSSNVEKPWGRGREAMGTLALHMK